MLLCLYLHMVESLNKKYKNEDIQSHTMALDIFFVCQKLVQM